MGRISQWMNRRRRAAKLGVKFNRLADFQVPPTLHVGGGRQALELPADGGSKGAFIGILLDDCYELQSLPDTIRTVLDVGAHAGLFSLAARMRFPEAQIHAYEPNPLMHPFLARQAEAGRFLFFKEALGPVEGRVSLDVKPESVLTTVHQDELGKIACIRFSTAVARMIGPVDLVKLDCEGAEWEILRETEAWRGIGHLRMEYHLWAGYTLAQLEQQVRSLGFKIRTVAPGGKDFGLLSASRD